MLADLPHQESDSYLCTKYYPFYYLSKNHGDQVFNFLQQLQGHEYIETTMIYTHVLRDFSKVPKSPLDSLGDKLLSDIHNLSE